MNSGRTIFSQIMDYLPTYEFRQCAERYAGNHKVKSFSCWDQFLSMVFAQLTDRESLRDIQACLQAAKQKTYHMGIRGKISRNTLADRIILQVNQTASADQGVLRHIRKCNQNKNMDCDLCLCADGDHQETAESGAESLYDFTNYQCDAFRENTAFPSAYRC